MSCIDLYLIEKVYPAIFFSIHCVHKRCIFPILSVNVLRAVLPVDLLYLIIDGFLQLCSVRSKDVFHFCRAGVL